MDWNRNGMNGVISSHDNHQYLPVSTSSTVSTIQSNAAYVPHRTMTQPVQLQPTDRYLKKLLKAKSSQELLHIQQSAIKSHKRIAPMQQVNQASMGQYNSYSVPTASNQSGLNVQNPGTSNYLMVTYKNTVQQTPQQPQLVPAMQQYDASGYHVRERQQSMQNGQATAGYTYSHQNVAQPVQNVYSNIRQPANTVQTPYRQVPNNNNNSPPTYSLQNGGSGPYINSHKMPTETNVPVNSPDYRNSQTGGNFSTGSYVNILPQQQQTVLQWNGNGMNYVQRPQRALMQEVQSAVPNSSQVVATSTNAPAVQMPLPYTQGITSQSNVLNGPINPQFVNQNYVAQNVQQPIQSVKGPQDQSSAAPPPQTQGGGVSQEHAMRRRELLVLLHVYRSVKQKYLLLNHENNLLRQKLKAANASQENASPAISAPLICTLQNAPAPANEAVAAQQNLTQTEPLQNPSPLATASGFPAQNTYKNAINVPSQNSAQTSQTFPVNGCIPNQVCTSSDRNVLDQNNYLVFDGGQMNTGSFTNSINQAQSPKNLNTKDQNVAGKDSIVHANSNNRCLSSGSSCNANVSQNEHPVNTLHSREQTNPVVSEHLNTATCPTKTSYDYGSYYAALINAETHSREAIEAALPLWKSVPQFSPLNKDVAKGPEGKQAFVGLTVNAFNILEQTLASKNETTSVVSPQKPKLPATPASKCVARVSPLVQSKELVHKESPLPKLVLKDEDLEIHSNDRLDFNLKENECIKELLHALQSINVPQNIESLIAVERPQSPTSILTQSIPSSAEVPQKEVEQNSTEDIADNDLQISGVCTLVEGNSYYDSSIALIFDNAIKTEANETFPDPDTGDDHALQRSEHMIDSSCDPEATDSNSPNTDVAIDAQPLGNEEAGFGLTNDENLHGSGVPCFQMQNDHSELSASDAFCDLEDSPGSDQLSELLTAFPFGIKNYMSENKFEEKESMENLADKPVICKVSLPVEVPQPAFDNNGQNQDMPPTSANVCTLDKEMEFKSLHEPTADPEPVVEQLPTPTKNDQTLLEEISLPPTDDCFEICDSPENDIQITLLDQDDIPKLFPDDSEQLLTPKCEQIETESCLEPTCTEESKDPVLNVQLNPLKTENTFANETTVLPDKDFFCCFLSWSAHINGNAPKCECKLAESPKADQPYINSGDFNAVVTESSGNLNETSLSNSSNAEVNGLKSKILPHNDKLSPVPSSSQHRSGLQYHRWNSQEDTKSKTASILNRAPEGGLKKNKDLTHEKSFQSSKERDHFQIKKPKSNSLKSEKLIVKTDFLKNKHSRKEKRRHKTKEKAKDAQGAYDTRGNIKKTVEKIDELDKSNTREMAQGVKSKQSSYTTKHMDRSMNKSMPSLSLARSTPTDTGHRRHERVKKRPESHYDKMRKVQSVPEYLQRKRDLINKRYETKPTQEETEERRTFDDKLSLRTSGYNSLPNLKRPLSPVKMNVSSKTGNSESDFFKVFNRTSKDRPQSSGPYETVNRAKEQMRSSSKDKIYLSPCTGSRGPSYEGLSLTKLQIRCSPDKRDYYERRKSLESSIHRKSSKSEVKKTESPKMLEFKLYPEFVHRSLATQENPGEPKTSESKSVVEGIKSKKEAWCSTIPFKKRKLESFEDKGGSAPSVSPISTPTYKPIQRGTTRPTQDSRATFNAFKQMYHEQRSKSLDGRL
ncbi:retroelement silencing factor 1 isoform X2 [Pseudophryne corroboree]